MVHFCFSIQDEYKYLREEAKEEQIDEPYYTFCCDSKGHANITFCRLLPNYDSPQNLFMDYTFTGTDDHFVPVMINNNNSLVQKYRNTVKDDTIIYCVYDMMCSNISKLLNAKRLNKTLPQPTPCTTILHPSTVSVNYTTNITALPTSVLPCVGSAPVQTVLMFPLLFASVMFEHF